MAARSSDRNKSRLLSEKLELLEYLVPDTDQGNRPTDAVVPGRAVQEAPLSFTQYRLWILDQWFPFSSTYNICQAFRLRGRLDTAALGRSLGEIVRRHEALRTSFPAVNGEPVQVVAQLIALPFAVIDLSALAPEVREDEAHRIAEQDAQQPFDLSVGPLLRTSLLRLGEEDHILLLTMHHIVVDGWSLALLTRELSALYTAFTKGESSPLADLPIQYPDFAVWQRSAMQGAKLAEHTQYWSEQLAGAPPMLNLPTDYSRPAVSTFRGRSVPFRLSPALSDALKELSRQQNASLFMSLLAAFKVLLYRYTAQEDLVVGTPIAGRTVSETENLIGCFINTLPLRTRLSGELTFLQVLDIVRDGCLDAYSHQELPFEKLVDVLQPERTLSYNPIFQVMLSLGNSFEQALDLPNVHIDTYQIDTNTAKLDLNLALEETPQGLFGILEYSTDLFEAATINRLIGHWQTLLAAIVRDPDKQVALLPLLPAEEREQLLRGYNHTTAAYPDHLCLHQLVEAQVERTPDAVAVVFEGEELTFRELNACANQLAHHLQERGVGPEILVGVCMERSLELVVALLGVMKAGAAYVPLDPTYPEARLRFIMQDAAVPLVLTQQHLNPPVASELLYVDQAWSALAPASRENPACSARPENLAYVIYTSGSTGQPKGAMNEHRGIVNRLFWMQETYQLTPADRVLQKTPIGFDVSVWEFFWPLITGARMVLARPEGHKDAAYLIDLIKREGLTTLHFVPSMLEALLADPDVSSCSTLRHVFCSGEALPAELQRRFFAHLPGALHNLYGPTEAAIDVSFWQCRPDDQRHTVPIGRPIANTQLYVLDSRLELVPVGVPGELHIGGVGVGRGYRNRPDLTGDAFIADPFRNAPDAQLYKTGDLVRRLPDGTLDFLGRIDHQVKLRGFRIELGEIETVLMAQPDVQATVVLVREDAPGDKRLVAYVVPTSGASPDIPRLRAGLQAALPEYMVPAAFVLLPALPLSPNGKVDRRALPAPSWETAGALYTPPRNMVESILADIWADVLKRERVGINDSFFDIGGDSIRSIQVIASARQRGVHLSIQDLYQHRTIGEIAGHVQADAAMRDVQAETEPFSLITAADREKLPPGLDDAYPLTQLQRGMLYHAELTPELPVYHNVNSHRLPGPFDQEALQSAIDRAVSRHPILRTAFDLTGYSVPIQVVHKQAAAALIVHDIRHLSPEEQASAAAEFVSAEANHPFDLRTAPLMRFFVHLLNDDTFQFCTSEHHAILDGWSFTSLLAEIVTSYFALVQKQEPPVDPVPTTTFRDYVHAEQLAVQSAEAKQFWMDELRDSVPLNLPPSLSQGDVPVRDRWRTLNVGLPSELVEGLRGTARSANVPLKSVLLAAYAKVLSVLTGDADVVTGVPTHGRLEVPHGEKVRGLFLNTLPLRIVIPERATWMELAKQVFAVEQRALPFRRYPFAEIQRAVGQKDLLTTAFLFLSFHELDTAVWAHQLHDFVLANSEMSHFKLQVAFSRNSITGQIELGLGYDAHSLTDEQARSVAAYLISALRHMADSPGSAHGAAALLPESETRRLLKEGDRSTVGLQPETTLHRWFEAQAARYADTAALSYEGKLLSYAELNQQSNRIAHGLLAAGAVPGRPIALMLPTGFLQIAALLAVNKVGSPFVCLDPNYPTERLRHILEDVRPPLLLAADASLAEHVGLLDTVPSACHAITIPADEEFPSVFSNCDADNLAIDVSPDALAYIVYTSGSTGKPKGIMQSHRSFAQFTAWFGTYFGFGPGKRLAQWASITYDASYCEIFGALCFGATLCLAAPRVRYTPAAAVRWVSEEMITMLQVVPSFAKQIMNVLATSPGNPFATLDHMLLAGEVLPTALACSWIERFGESPRLHNLYGPTECVLATYFPVTHAAPEQKSVPIGHPIDGRHILILNRDGQICPVGVIGEIYVRSTFLSAGYWQRPEETAAAFVPNPLIPAETIYRTRDLGRWLPNGAIEYWGRSDHLVKVRGIRIELEEIEAALAQHPTVREAIVSPYGNEEATRLFAYVVPDSHVRGDATDRELMQQWQRHLRGILPDHMLPAGYVLLDNLPRTPNGKVSRRALPAPDSASVQSEVVPYAAPSSPLEEVLCGIWAEVLDLERIGMHANFFELGGHSLLATQVISRVREIFQVDLALRSLFVAPSVAEFARLMGADPAAAERHLQTAQLLVDLAHMSDSEVDALLIDRSKELFADE